MILVLEEQVIHRVTRVVVTAGIRTVEVRCGAEVPGESAAERPLAWTGWYSQVSCPACLACFEPP